MDTASRLLAVVARLRDETYPGATRPVTLDAGLERELGLDSLARAELLMRVEREFGCRLGADLLGTVETPRDLLAALARVNAGRAPEPGAGAVPESGEGAAAPRDAATLTAVLEWHARHQPGRIHIVHLGEEGEEPLSYGELWRRANAVAAGLQARGLRPGEKVALMLPTCVDFFTVFCGIQLAGGVPVPIYPPARPRQLEDHLRRHAAILANAEAAMLVGFAGAAWPVRLLQAQVACLRETTSAAELVAAGGAATRMPAEPGQLALLQYTSGSTGNPKGVMLTHANVLANVRAMVEATQAGPRDVFVSWLPLYHDMGLICAWLASLCFGMRLAVMSPLLFLASPVRWLRAIDQQRGTLSGAPNFAYELCVRRIGDTELEGLDLSRWRVAFNGAEPVNADTMARFAERFARYGLRAEALAPAYGLAENAVGLAVSPQRGVRVDHVRRQDFATRGMAVPAAPGDDALSFVACGRPLPGHDIRIVDAVGNELPERREGTLQFRGPSSCAGYYRNPAATRALLTDGWLDSGDYAYLAGGEVYPTGRAKDVIIKGGRNLYPQELEQAVNDIPGIRRGNVAVFASADPATGAERLVVAAETRETDAAARARLRGAIETAALETFGVSADDVVLSSEHIVLKTSSGKIRRAASRELYERGGETAPRAVWLQVLRLAAAGALPGMRRLARALRDLVRGVWAWCLFKLFFGPVWLGVALMPRPAAAWAVARFGARALGLLSGIRLRVSGTEHLAGDAPCVVVANHASYVDGIAVVAALPYRRWRFVAKRELAADFVARVFLSRLGCEFVERFDFRQGVADARRVADSIAGGHSPIFFAEGTFTRAAGLLPFRMGAFVTAAQTDTPVLPLALAGTRDLLRDGTSLPRCRDLTLTVGAPIAPAGRDWQAAVQLREAARAEILRHCGEPDLGG